jgi:hypothetical protein
MDKLAQQLLALELAIPGLYAAVLKLIKGTISTKPSTGLKMLPRITCPWI